MLDLRDHLQEIFVIDAADLPQGGEVAPGQEIQMVEQWIAAGAKG